MLFNSYNVLIGVIILALWFGLLISFGMALFYSGKMVYDIGSGRNDYIVLFHKTMVATGVGFLLCVIVDVFSRSVGLIG